jgi:hypothetical protein
MIKPAVYLAKIESVSEYHLNSGFGILCQLRSLEAATEMFESGLVSVHGHTGGEGPLKSALSGGKFETADYLIEKGALVNFPNHANGVRTELPLEQEVRLGHLDAVKYLLEKGALVADDVVDRARAEVSADRPVPDLKKIVELLRLARKAQLEQGLLKSRYSP